MAYEYELLSVTDKPALLGLTTLEWQARVLAVLDALGYKVHVAQNHEDFCQRFTQYQYQVVIIEELFDCASLATNQSLTWLQNLPMNLRRHAAVLLLGDSFQTLNPMQAFVQSVHLVVNSAELGNLEGLLQKVVGENDLFLGVYRQVQGNISQGLL